MGWQVVCYKERRKGTKKRSWEQLYVENGNENKFILIVNKSEVKKKATCVVQHRGSRDRYSKNRAGVSVESCRDIKEHQSEKTLRDPVNIM